MFNLTETPYSLDSLAESRIRSRIDSIEERVYLLRNSGTLSDETVRRYYGEKRFEQVSESNAIEGSTLSVGETEAAVRKGITITGHDPAFVRDAVALDKALQRLTELATLKATSTNLEQLQEIHAILLEGRSGAGMFRREKVMITGSKHMPPKTWDEIIEQMEVWEHWSVSNNQLPPPIRATILHAWLVHIHPYIDGNGRTARAITNLELIRAGYPPIIIKKKEKDRYIDALAESDEAGDIGSLLELVFDRIEGSFTGLEQSARNMQGYDPIVAKFRMKQEAQRQVWQTSITLLASMLQNQMLNTLERINGVSAIKMFDSLDVDEYNELCRGRSVTQSWAFIVSILVPGLQTFEMLAYIGHRSAQMYQELNREGGASLYWSSKNPSGFPKWKSDSGKAPYAVELTTKNGIGDFWYAKTPEGRIEGISATDLARRIGNALLEMAST